jgi:hypothetical protein
VEGLLKINYLVKIEVFLKVKIQFVVFLVVTLCSDSSTWVYPKVTGLAAWSENCKLYSSLSLGAVVSLFCQSV